MAWGGKCHDCLTQRRGNFPSLVFVRVGTTVKDVADRLRSGQGELKQRVSDVTVHQDQIECVRVFLGWKVCSSSGVVDIFFNSCFPCLDMNHHDFGAVCIYQLTCQHCPHKSWLVLVSPLSSHLVPFLSSGSVCTVKAQWASCILRNSTIVLKVTVLELGLTICVQDLRMGTRHIKPLGEAARSEATGPVKGKNSKIKVAFKDGLPRWQKKKAMGICLGDGDHDWLTNLRFVDDVLLFASTKGAPSKNVVRLRT